MREYTGRIIICGADEIDGYRAFGITHLIRIVNPGIASSCPNWFTHDYLQLSFGDVLSEADARDCRTKAPDLNDIRRAIVFGRMAFRENDSCLLISCDYGASRSPAVAYVILSDQMGAGCEAEALEEILRIRPDSVPNSRVVMIADRLLGRNGNLMGALRTLYGEIESTLEQFECKIDDSTQHEPDQSPEAQKRYMLSNIGHKRLLERRKDWSPLNHTEQLMAKICEQGVASLSGSRLVEQLLSDQWIEAAPDSMTPDDARLRYARNPLENQERVNFEMTTLCNFTCKHCRNGGVAPRTETDLSLLKETAMMFLSIGIRRFDFIGGEVSLFGNGWLELARYITEYDQSLNWQRPLMITLYTNGWWLEEKNFSAAGIDYSDDMEFLNDMQRSGITHILFSIDGPEEIHDQWRGHPRLFRRIFSGMGKVRRAGINPRVSVVARPNENLHYLRPFARRMYGPMDSSLLVMQADPANLFCNFIDTGRGANLRKGNAKLRTLNPDLIRCKAFFRPWPTIRIMANGAIGICPIMQGQEGYGNVHEQPLPRLLNRLQETPLYKLHASGEISQYLSNINPDTFGETFDHVCAVRREVNLIALEHGRDIVGKEKP